MSENVVRDKSFAFSLRIMALSDHLLGNWKNRVIADQILRSGTSIGANIEEGTAAILRKEFIAKFAIAYKEAKETHYRLRLLTEGKKLERKLGESMLTDCDELCRILGAIIKTSKTNS